MTGMKRRLRVALSIVSVAGVVAGLAIALSAAASATPPAATAAAAASPPACSAGAVVRTKDGTVCGSTAEGITSYLGVPYAAPPVGRLRWRPPQPAHPWTGTLHATTQPQQCPSPGFPPGSPPASNTSEDCLFVNIMTPAGARPGQRLPVMYEIHGGGFLGEAPTFNGENLVSSGNVVYVFVGYRLGILGFLADKSLGPHSGNYGLQDQQAGLRWVKQNIARFGGNPNNVTIFGESAGGASVCDAVASPTANGLFRNAISVSGFYNYQNNIVWSNADCKSTYFTESQAQKAGAQFAKKVGCGNVADVAACLRRVPVTKLVEDGGQFVEPTAGGTIGPIVNGTTLTMSPAKAFATGRVNHVNMIIDVGRDEFNGGVYANPPGMHIVVATTPAQYRTLVREQFGRLAPIVERLYPLSKYASPYTAYRTIMADSASVCPELQADQKLSRYIPVYADINNDADNPAAVAESPEPLGAMHSGTNSLVHFASSKLDASQAALQNQLLAEWTQFARTGNPNAAHTPEWTPYSRGNASVMSLRPADTSGLTPARSIAAQHNCGFWDATTRY